MIALVYSGEGRDNGTPLYFRAALKQTGTPFRWYWPQGKVPTNHSFHIVIDDGRDDIRYLPPHPCGYYATDTHLGWSFRRRKAEHFDIVWCAQKPAAERMRAEGLNAHWLPLACHPMAHPTAQELTMRTGKATPPVEYDLAFVGHLQPPETSNRVEFLDEVMRGIPNTHFAFGVFHEQMAAEYHKARIGLNHAVRDDLNMRFFELASVGVPQLCDRRMVGMADLGFDEGLHYIGYESAAEAIEQAKLWLTRPNELLTMVREALAIVRVRNTYLHRINRMLADINELPVATEQYKVLA